MMLMLAVWLIAAQQVTPLNSVPPNPTAAWSQEAGTLQEAQSYVYRYYLDGATNGAAFSGVVCTGTASPWSCQAPLPVTLGGEHTITVTAELTTGERGGMSAPATFTIELLGAPTPLGGVVIIK
jgi:hypothetical protein